MKLYVTHDIRLGILDKENVPFLCLMNKDLKTTQLFVPIKEIQEHSEHFYRIPYVRFSNLRKRLSNRKSNRKTRRRASAMREHGGRSRRSRRKPRRPVSGIGLSA